MEYQWEDSKECCRIQLLTSEEFQRAYGEILPGNFTRNEPDRIRFCRADRFHQNVAGTFAIPKKEDPSSKKLRFAYYLMEDRVFPFIFSGCLAVVIGYAKPTFLK